MNSPESKSSQSVEGPSLPTFNAQSDISFARELMKRNVFSVQQLDAINKNIRQVEARAQDETMYLAILGEFNSGKSTFVNALLRYRLLKSAPRATTAAATFLRYAPDFSLRVHFVDKTVATGSENDFANLQSRLLTSVPHPTECRTLQDLLILATIDPLLSKEVSLVEVCLPADTLRTGTVIIDTPGIGAGADSAQHHSAITERVTEDTADVAIILVPADSAMTQTLITFLEAKTRRFLHRCIFIITKMDNLGDDDRSDVCEFVEGKLKQILGRKPLLFQSAAVTMFAPNGTEMAMSQSSTFWRQSFVEMEQVLHHELTRNRSLVIAEHLASLLHCLLRELQDAVTTRRTELARERATLDQSSVSKLEGVLADLYQRCRVEIEQEAQACKLRISDDGAKTEDWAVKSASGMLDNSTRQTLNAVVESGIPSKIKECQDNFNRACDHHLSSLRSTCERIEQLFTQQFESNYRNLRSLGLKIEIAKFAEVSESLSRTRLSPAGDFLKAAASARARIGAGVGAATGCIGAPAGAVAGSICGMLAGCGVGHGSAGGGLVGLLLGGLIGFVGVIVAGGMLGANVGAKMSDLEKERKEVRALLLPQIQNHFRSLAASHLQEFERARQTAVQILDQSAHAHTLRYSEIVNRMIQEHDRKAANVAQQQKQAEVDSNELLTRTHHLDEVRSKLASVGQ